MEQKIKSPKTGRPITLGKSEYNKLLSSGYTVEDLNKLIIKQEKIKSPKTNRMIIVGGPTYNKLVKDGYINTTTNENKLPNEAMVQLILNTPPYDLISLYKTNKSYHQLFNTLHVLNLLYEKHDVYKCKQLSFQDFIYSYMEEEMRNLYFSRHLYLESQLYTALTIISDYWNNYKLKITDFYHNLGSKSHMVIQYLKNHGFKNEIKNVTEPYQEWLKQLETKIYQYILSKKGHYHITKKPRLVI